MHDRLLFRRRVSRRPGGMSIARATARTDGDPRIPMLLGAYLDHRLGQWPAASALDVVGSEHRTIGDWDGTPRPALGIRAPAGAVLSVPPDRTAEVIELARRGGTDGLRTGLARAVGQPRLGYAEQVFRWSTDPAPLAEAGVWLAADGAGVPQWLRIFGGEVLVALDARGTPVAGVGIKHHNAFGRELAVMTRRAARGQGLARRLVARAARRVLDEGALPLYTHDPSNVASGRVADMCGFPDLGWSEFGTVSEPSTHVPGLLRMIRR